MQPISPNGSPEGATAELVCGRCSTTNPADADRCAKCRSWLSGNQAARTSGLYARHQPADVLLTADELLAGVIVDKGGLDQMSTLERAYANKLRAVDVLLSVALKAFIE